MNFLINPGEMLLGTRLVRGTASRGVKSGARPTHPSASTASQMLVIGNANGSQFALESKLCLSRKPSP